MASRTGFGMDLLAGFRMNSNTLQIIWVFWSLKVPQFLTQSKSFRTFPLLLSHTFIDNQFTSGSDLILVLLIALQFLTHSKLHCLTRSDTFRHYVSRSRLECSPLIIP